MADKFEDFLVEIGAKAMISRRGYPADHLVPRYPDGRGKPTMVPLWQEYAADARCVVRAMFDRPSALKSSLLANDKATQAQETAERPSPGPTSIQTP